MMLSEIKPVLIVGAGPTGMTAAMELARLGVPVRLIDKKAVPDTTSRAIGIQARTLELFEQRGLTDEMLRLGNRSLAASIYGDGKRVLRLDYRHVDSRYDYILFLSQAETERVLREQLARENITVERPVEMIALARKESGSHPGTSGGVTATLRHADGTLEEVEAAYLISAEGAHSTVRSSLGLEFSGKSLSEDYALGDLHVEGDLPATDLHIFSSKYGFMGMFPMGGGHFRLIASNPLSKPSKDTEPSLEELQKMYDMRSHIPVKFHELTWSSWFRINSRMIDHLQQGRIFLGGDSAHIHSPAAAQGMNSGIQDMINLGWKLAFVMQGTASPKLLGTYSEDRIPVIRNVLAKTEGLTEVIGAENPVFRTLFEHVAPMVVGTDFVQENSASRMSQVALNYRMSTLSETHGHHGRLRAGDRVPDMTLRVMNPEGSAEQAPREARLFSLLNPSRFTLLFVEPREPASLHAEVQARLASWHSFIDGHQIAPLQEPGESKHFANQFGSGQSLVLIRPDGYIGFLGSDDALPALANYLGKWFTPEEDTKKKNDLEGHPGNYHAKS